MDWFDVENLEKANGLPIAVTGIIIVFTVLTVISIAIALLPKILSLLPEASGASHADVELPVGATGVASGQPAGRTEADDGVVVALALALAERQKSS